jgi:hypothetical protein
MLLVNLEQYLLDRGIKSLHLSREGESYMGVARMTGGRTVSARGASLDAVVASVLFNTETYVGP